MMSDAFWNWIGETIIDLLPLMFGAVMGWRFFSWLRKRKKEKKESVLNN